MNWRYSNVEAIGEGGEERRDVDVIGVRRREEGGALLERDDSSSVSIVAFFPDPRRLLWLSSIPSAIPRLCLTGLPRLILFSILKESFETAFSGELVGKILRGRGMEEKGV